MKHMFVFHYHKDLHRAYGEIVAKFSNSDDEKRILELEMDRVLGRREFLKEVPKCDLVEVYNKVYDYTDWIFVRAYTPPRSRDMILEANYTKMVFGKYGFDRV